MTTKQELLEKLRWHLAGVNSISRGLRALGVEIKLATFTAGGSPLLIIEKPIRAD